MPYLTPMNIPSVFTCRRLFIPDDTEVLGIVNGALVELTKHWNFEQVEGVSVDETIQAFAIMLDKYWDIPCMLGAIFPYVTATPPYGTLPCDGSTHLKADYPDLYDKLDSAFIVDSTHFKTPDLRGRAVIGTGTGDGLSNRAVAEIGGEEKHTLVETELAGHSHTTQPHSHTAQPHSHTDAGHTHFVPIPTFAAIEPGEAPTYTPLGIPSLGQTTTPSFANITPSVVAIDGAAVTVDAAGGDEAHNNMQPFFALPYCIVAR